MLTANAFGKIDYGSLVLPDRVHGRVFTDPEIFEAEMAVIYGSGWVYVGHESEVPSPGDFRTSHVGRQPVIITRDDAGEVHVLMNRCTHRAAVVCSQESGNTKSFKCPYHQWSFRNSGQLVGVPYPGGYGPGFNKSDFDLARPPRTDSYRGFIFASMTDDGPDLDEHLGPLVKEQIDLFVNLSPEGEIECKAGVNRFFFKGNWKLQVDNTADFYHVNFLHRSLLDVLIEQDDMNIADMSNDKSPALNVSLGRGHTMMDIRPYNRAKKNFVRDNVLRGGGPRADYIRALQQSYGESRTDELLIAGGTHMAVWPNLGVLSGMIRRIRPIKVDLTEVILAPAFLKGVPEEMNTSRLRGHENFFPPAGMGGSDDQDVFERVQLGLCASVNPWLLAARGMHRETVRPDGSVAAQVTDELNTRAIFHHWRDLMSQHTPHLEPERGMR